MHLLVEEILNEADDDIHRTSTTSQCKEFIPNREGAKKRQRDTDDGKNFN